MYEYDLYGLRLQSNRPLSGLEVAKGDKIADWVIHIFGNAVLPGGWHSKQWDNSVLDAKNKILLSTSARGVEPAYQWFHIDIDHNTIDIFVATDSQQLWVSWQQDVPESIMLELVSDWLSQIVLTYWLRLQGYYVLHAAAIQVDKRAFLLVAKSGTGKSSLTLALAKAGLSVLSEETGIIHFTGQACWVQPGSRRLRLWQNTLDAMGISVEGLTQVPPLLEKYYLPLSAMRGCSNGIQPTLATPGCLSCIYWIEGRDHTLEAPNFQNLSQSASTTMLLNNRYHPFPVGSRQVARELQQAVHLAKSVPIRQIRLPDRIEQLTDTAAAILADFNALSSNQ